MIENSRDARAAGEAQAERITEEAKERAAELATETEVIKVAQQKAAQIVAEAETDAAALRREADAFVDSRMASFESVLARTTSQVRTARARLAERSRLDRHEDDVVRRPDEPPSAGAGTTSRSRDLGTMTSPHRRLDRRSGLVLDTHDLASRAGRAARRCSPPSRRRASSASRSSASPKAPRWSSTCGWRRSSRVCWSPARRWSSWKGSASAA